MRMTMMTERVAMTSSVMGIRGVSSVVGFRGGGDSVAACVFKFAGIALNWVLCICHFFVYFYHGLKSFE